MEKTVVMKRIGSVRSGNGFSVHVDPEYAAALKGLGDFSHVKVIWEFDQAPRENLPLVYDSCYKSLDGEIGIFATRGPMRPNPIAVSTCRILSVDDEKGVIHVDWIDAADNSPLLDIKAYHPSEDIARDVSMPSWCAHWPRCREDSSSFKWEDEFNF